ncbi:hypothetical protein PtB15_7B158 [Puccinia triticina]|nr:hypothetical protein PtB15_7B158 [Puccinia triticina]
MQSQQYTNGGPAHRPGSNQANSFYRGGDLIDPRFAQPNPNHTLGHRLGQQANIPVTTPFSQRGTPDGIFQSAPNPSQPASSHINHNLLRVPNPSQPDPQQASSLQAQEELNVPKKDTRGWPGTNTAVRLAIFGRKLVVHPNPPGLTPEHLINCPVKKMKIKETWLVLRGLKNNWIELKKHNFDATSKQSHQQLGGTPTNELLPTQLQKGMSFAKLV